MEIILRNSKPFLMNNQSVLFSIWLLLDVAKLQCYKENGEEIGKSHTRVQPFFEQLESLMKTFFNSDPPEEQLRSFMLLVSRLLIEYWPPNVNSLFILWDFFNKKMNSSSYVAGCTLDSLALISNCGLTYLQSVKNQMDEKCNLKKSSFSMFTYILGSQLKRFYDMGQTNQILKILGRIYSKFSPGKLLALNEMGIHNVITLFLTLILTANMKEVVSSFIFIAFLNNFFNFILEFKNSGYVSSNSIG